MHLLINLHHPASAQQAVNIDNGYGAATSALRLANMMRRAAAGE